MQIQREALDMRLDRIREQAIDARNKANSTITQIDELSKWLDKQQLEDK